MAYKSSPRPTFSAATHIPYGSVTRFLWGDEEAGFVSDELKTGKLIQPFDVVAASGFNYYLVYPETNRLPRKTQLFRDWILAEAGHVLKTPGARDVSHLTR
jgi:hypothetical protein